MGGILATTQRRLKCVSIISGIFGFAFFITSLSIYDWACQNQDEILVTNYECESKGDIFNCNRRHTWQGISVVAVIFSVYQIISSAFLFQASLGMRSWIIGNFIISVYCVFFACFIIHVFPNLMALYLFNFIVLSTCSALGYYFKNMTAFEESSMSLLT